MATFPASSPTVGINATTLMLNNATTAGLPNSSGFDRLTYVEDILGNLLTDLPSGISVTGVSLRSSSSQGGIGYTTGAGSSVTQATSKVTAFTCNTITGRITFNNSAMAGWLTSSAVWTCSAINSTSDLVLFNHTTGGTVGLYTFNASCTTSSSAVIFITNNSTASASEAPVVNYAIFRGALS